MKRVFAGVGVMLLTVALVAGCGSEKSLTKAEFVKKGNAICTAGNKRIESAAKKQFASGDQPTQAQITKFAKDIAIPSIQKDIDGLRDLNPPKADKDKVNEIIDAAQSALDKTKADPSVFGGEGSPAPFKKANRLATAYGLTVCGAD